MKTSKRTKNRILNRLMKECQVSKQGILVASMFDHNTMRHIEKIVVPQTYIYSILTILHNKLMHPSPHQLVKTFEKYFFAPNSQKIAAELKEKCDTCITTSRIPQINYFQPNNVPEHLSSHLKIDIIYRASQKIAVCTDMFSLFTTASFITNESREILEQAVIRLIMPI